MNANDKKIFDFSNKIKSQIAEMITSDECENSVKNELQTEEDFECFLHAMSTVVPTSFMKK